MSKDKIKKFGFKDFFVIVIFLFIAFFCVYLFWHDLMQTLNLQNVEPVGTVVIRKNTVQRRFASRVLWDRLSDESPVYVGDLIRIADVSAATIYIGGSSIELEENTLIRIVLAPDGESLVIQVTSGEVSVFSAEDNIGIFVEVDGRQVQAQPGVVLTASVTETGNEFQTSGITEWLENTGRLDSMRETKIKLISPAVNSLIRYSESSAVVNFQWEEAENAIFYEAEISATPGFSNPVIRESFITPYMTETRLGEGTWYWRVRPVYSSVYNYDSAFSDISYFRVVRNQSENEAETISEWLALESPLFTEPPPDLPVEFIPAFLIQPEPEPEPEPIPPPPPPPPAPVVRLPAPRNMSPARGTVYMHDDLRSLRTIDFTWSRVPEATAYIFTLYQQTYSGRQLILRTNPLTAANYSIGNLSVLDRGTFIWQVEAIVTGRGNTIVRRGTIGESSFTLDFQLPGPVQIEDTGILYGN